MGRASGQSASQSRAAARRRDYPGSWVAERLRPYLDLEVVDHGVLDEFESGHAVGTPYVTVRAATEMDRDKARHMLEDRSGLTGLAWECGWTGRILSDGRNVTELTLFPDRPVPAQHHNLDVELDADDLDELVDWS